MKCFLFVRPLPHGGWKSFVTKTIDEGVHKFKRRHNSISVRYNHKICFVKSLMTSLLRRKQTHVHRHTHTDTHTDTPTRTHPFTHKDDFQILIMHAPTTTSCFQFCERLIYSNIFIRLLVIDKTDEFLSGLFRT